MLQSKKALRVILLAAGLPWPVANSAAHVNTYHKDFVMDAPWRVRDANTPIPLVILLKDCDTDDIRRLHWIGCWDVTAGRSTRIWYHDFRDERIGDDATEANFWTYVTAVTEGHPDLSDGSWLTPANLGYGPGDAIQLKITIDYTDDILGYSETRYLRVRVGSGPFPWPDTWYGGDLHYHTMYTNNIAEFGAPLPAVRAAAIAMGLQWLATADHSCDLDETGDGSVSYATPQWEYTLQTPGGTVTRACDNRVHGSTWNALGADVAAFGDGDFRLVRGEEVNLASIDPASRDKTLHALFVGADYVLSPRSGALNERPVVPNVTEGLGRVSGGGFVLAAHPSLDLGLEMGGADFAVNGAIWGDQDLAAGLSVDRFVGLEGFNMRPTLYSDDVGRCPNVFDCVTDPWPDFDARMRPGSTYPSELLREIALWEELLHANLAGAGAVTDPRSLRRISLAGGSDAHGDFNFSTNLGLPNYATDNAMGKVQTVAHVPGPYGPGQLPPVERIADAIRDGRTIVTDGPFLEIGVDVDGDGDWLGAEDLQIGSAGQAASSAAMTLHVRWASLPEFGPITAVRVVAGSALQTEILLETDPSASGQGLAGSASVDLAARELEGSWYFRAECLTADGDAGHRAYTNPIWIQFRPTPIEVEDLAVAGDGGAVRLTWRLSRSSLPALAGVRVQRSEGRAGPYEDRTSRPLAPERDMTYVDAEVAPGVHYWYRLILVGADATERGAGPVEIALSDSRATTLYPPFVTDDGDAIAIRYRVARGASAVRLEVFGTDGRHVRSLDTAAAVPGEHLVYWDRLDDRGEKLGRGVYFIRLHTDGMTMSEKIVLLHR
jgi:hypothetical protein